MTSVRPNQERHYLELIFRLRGHFQQSKKSLYHFTNPYHVRCTETILSRIRRFRICDRGCVISTRRQ